MRGRGVEVLPLNLCVCVCVCVCVCARARVYVSRRLANKFSFLPVLIFQIAINHYNSAHVLV